MGGAAAQKTAAAAKKFTISTKFSGNRLKSIDKYLSGVYYIDHTRTGYSGRTGKINRAGRPVPDFRRRV